MDSDDFWPKDKLEKQINNMLKNSYNFTYTDYNFFFNDTYPKWLEESKLSYILMQGSVKLISMLDKNNQSIDSLEKKIKEKSNSLFEKSIDSRLRRDKNDDEVKKGYKENDRSNLDQLIDNIQDE